MKIGVAMFCWVFWLESLCSTLQFLRILVLRINLIMPAENLHKILIFLLKGPERGTAKGNSESTLSFILFQYEMLMW